MLRSIAANSILKARLAALFGCWLLAALSLAAVPAFSQAPGANAAGNVVQRIEDPDTGERWQLLRDPEHPGGPGRWVALGHEAGWTEAAAPRTLDRPRPIIVPGDRLRVERHTAILDEVLSAVALTAARAGESLRVRLDIGGRLLEVRALSPGHAELKVQEGAGL